MRIDGLTELIVHIGYPTHTFKSPLIYNPYFESIGANVVVVPLACRPEPYPVLLRSIFALDNVRGALVTMPHKVRTVELLDVVSPAVQVAGACNAVRRDADGRLVGDLFDGVGFVRGLLRKGVTVQGARALVVGCGGVGSAIAAALAAAGVAQVRVHDVRAGAAQALARRLAQHYPNTQVLCADPDPSGLDIVVNATPLGMHEGDPLPLDVSRLQPGTLVGEVVLRADITPLLRAALARGCRIQVGADMLYEQIPAYLEFFGLPTTTPDTLRRVAGQDAAALPAEAQEAS
ncbi:shikimate dehydrogenase [Tepidimonas ignava]|uniref:Shikimate dehydrogenase n=1 Tax=Tepidimonas ignava TaxID=114249 RepID=A0A4R3LCU1_9BURK|nr:shikimate dehydrogenase [Tepidimonas ignava]TCS97719.1 shikimate dehydrogenase [Tepidimonas ignava]TSE24006.1 Quinate/shikimate dehydrogenase [Tepidimonas ignava]